ncbi:MAG: hypothetical protein KDB80_04225 [Planctomycetes bacterium]|nr:hypothetical protein [Planctomycetota bacterium]
MTRKRIALLYFGFAVSVLVLTFVVLQRAGVSRAFVENLLADVIVRDRFRLGDANLHLGEGKLTLDEFELNTKASDGDRPFVAVDRIELDVDTNPLAFGDVGRIRQARVEGLSLELDLSEGNAPDLSELFEQTGEIDREGGPPPAIIVTNSRVVLRFAPDAAPAEFTDVDLKLLPEEPGSNRMSLSGSMTSPAGLRTTVSGTGDFKTREFRALLTIDEFPLDPSLATRFAPQVGAILDEARLTGTARNLGVWLEYSEGTDGRSKIAAGAGLEVTELGGIPPTVPYALVDATARINVSTRDNGTVRFELDDPDTAGDIHVGGVLTDCFGDAPIIDVELNAKRMLIRPQLTDALREVPAVRRILEAFEPLEGRFDVRGQVRSSEPGTPPRADLDLTFADTKLLWHGIPQGESMRVIEFPEPATDVSGRVRLRGHELWLEEIEFTACGGRSRIDATIGTRREEPYAIEFRSDDLPFSDRVRAALESVAPRATRFYDEFSPRGRSAISVALTGVGRDRSETRVELRPLDASASWAGFPYRVNGLSGVIEIEPRGVFFQLQGHHGAARTDLNGRFPAPADDGPLGTELWIAASGVPIDDELATALDELGPDFRKTWNTLGPEGTADCELTIWGEGDGDVSYDIRVDARRAAVELDELAIPIRNIEGPIFVHGTGGSSTIDFGVLRGEIANAPGTDPAELVMHGTGTTTAEGSELDLTSTIDHLQITDALRDAFDASGAFSRETWDVLRPSGFVSVVSRQRLVPGATELQHDLRIQLDGVNSDAAMLPAPARNMTGSVTVLEGNATFRDLRCDMGDSRVFCESGYAIHDQDATRIQAIVTSDEFPIDDDLANLLSGPIRETYLERELRGSLEVQHLDLRFRFPDTSDTFTLDLSGRVAVRDTTMSLGTNLENVSGTVRIERAHFDDVSGEITGTIDNGGMSIAGHRLSGAHAALFANAERVEFSGVSGRVHNGELFGLGEESADIRFEFGEPGRLTSALGWKDVSLSSILRASGSEDSEYRGNVSGELRIGELLGDDIVNAEATGSVQVTEGRLGEVPLFTAIYSHLTPNQRPRFNGVAVDFSVHDQRIDIHEVEATSSLISVSGQGTVTMDGYLDMELDFADLFGEDADWLVLPVFARVITTGVVKFQVFGYLRSLRARPQWLWESKPDRVRLGPIPARSADG